MLSIAVVPFSPGKNKKPCSDRIRDRAQIPIRQRKEPLLWRSLIRKGAAIVKPKSFPIGQKLPNVLAAKLARVPFTVGKWPGENG
jgi:hypothetical protein